MPSPSASLATLRPDLGGSVEEFNLAADRQGFIGLQILPVFETRVQAGSFGVIPIEQLLQNRETRRAPGGTYSRGKWKFETATFACEEHGTEEPVDDREAQMYADYFDAELVSAERARDVVLRNFEKRVAALLFASGTFTPTAVSTEWSTVATATPIADVAAAVLRRWAATGLWPNAIVMTRQVYLNLRRCAEILDRMEMVDRSFQGDIGVAHLRAAFDLPYVLVAGGTKNTATEGQDASIASIWDDEYVGIGRICQSRDIREPGIGRTLHWGADGSQIGALMESYRDETVRSNIIRARMDTQEKLIHTGCWELLSNITA